jgi:hypothetical protein
MRVNTSVIFKTHIISSREIKEMPIVSIKIANDRSVDIKRNSSFGVDVGVTKNHTNTLK